MKENNLLNRRNGMGKRFKKIIKKNFGFKGKM